MYYRRKIILSVLGSFGGRLDKIDLQKLLLIFTKQQIKPDFYFIPYKFGCYSLQANQDLNTLQKYGKVYPDKNLWILKDIKVYQNELTLNDRKILEGLKNEFTDMFGDELIRYTYLNFPYYSINSKIIHRILNNEEIESVYRHKSQNLRTGLYTIGYEGISIEEYLNKLIKNDIKVLCDVRKNPISMKYGFSKNQLKSACENLNINYLHFPDLGIDSKLRKQDFADDRAGLFEFYCNSTLKKNINSQERIIELIKEHKRVAITCFEADLNCCHRLHLANELIEKTNFTCTHL